MYPLPAADGFADLRARALERGRKRLGEVHVHAEHRTRNAHRGEHASIRRLNRRSDAAAVELVFLVVDGIALFAHARQFGEKVGFRNHGIGGEPRQAWFTL